MSIMHLNKGRYKYCTLGILLLLAILISLPILMEPWGADQAGFGHIAKGMLDGKVPYKDFYSLTGYGVFFTFALFFKLFGVNMASIHIGHLLVSLFSVVLVFLITDKLYGVKESLIASIFYVIFSNGLAFSGFGYENKSAWGRYWYLSQREVFMAPLIMVAILLLVIEREKYEKIIYFICGVLIGLAVIYKLTAILMLFLFIVFIAGEELIKGRVSNLINLRRALAKILFLLLGFVLIQLPFLYYFWSNGALKDMCQALFVQLSVYSKLSRGLRIETFFSGHYSVMSENLVLWLFSAISCLYILFKDRDRNNILIVLWAFFSLLMVWSQGKFFGYHFTLIMPPFAVLTGYGLPRFIDIGSGLKGIFLDGFKDIGKTFMLVFIIVSFIVFGISNYDYYMRHVMYFLEKMTDQDYYTVFNEFPTHPYSFRSDYQIAQYLLENKKPGDKLGVIFSAGDTVIHFLSGMEQATRFIQSWYLFSSDVMLSRNEITKNLRKEFIDQLIETAPRYILSVHIPFEELIEIPCLKEDPNVERLNSFIQNNYMLENVFPDNRFLFKKV